ncbi:MAG: aldolase/citrate lyase family protein [Desulfobacterales bacterium]
MPPPISFREALRGSQPLVGTVLTLPSAAVAEVLAEVGYDWFFVDGEHAPLGIDALVAILQAAQHRCPCLVRVPANEEAWIKRALDAGADGIIAPLVNSPETARQVVAWSKYPPEGRRSVGGGRAHGYGRTFDRYLQTANQRIAVIVQIEHVDGVRAIEAILDVAGIDAVFIGPYDLSGSLGKPGRIDDPEVQAHIRDVRDACLRRGKPLGIFTAAEEAARAYIDQGFVLLAVGADAVHLGNAAEASLLRVRG